jgi:VWFA-related protein
MAARGRSALYDALLAGLDYVGKGRYERRVLVVVADGGENASTAGIDEVLARVQTSSTLIYTIALVDPLDRETNPKRLERIAKASGGEAFAPRTIADVPDVLRHIARDIRSMYTLGYAPADAPDAARFRRIRVAVRTPSRQSLRVHTREGYLVEQRISATRVP